MPLNEAATRAQLIDPMPHIEKFRDGVVFGFDVGTASIGYAVRRGKEFLQIGARTVPEEVGNLKNRRQFRAQRRTLRAKKKRIQWLKEQLEKLGLKAPASPIQTHPVELRLKAIRGEQIPREELHFALVHLFKRRGYVKNVPWKTEASAEKKKEENEIEKKITALSKEMKEKNCAYPCEFLASLKPDERQRDRIW